MTEFVPCDETRAKLFGDAVQNVEAPVPQNKVSIVGVGAVGMACAYAVLNQGLCSELALVDVQADKLRGEELDLRHGASFLKRCVIRGSTDYKTTAHSNLIVITAGVRQREGESRLDLVSRNVAIFRKIVPPLVEHSPNAVFCVVSNPCDIMAWVTWRLSGLPRGRVFGSGTALDTSRFRELIAHRLGVDTRSVHGYVMGEHGDSSVAAWSTVEVGGQRLVAANPAVGTDADSEEWAEVHRRVVGAAGEVIRLKGYTSYGIGAAVASIAEAVLRDEKRVIALSTPLEGSYGVAHPVFLSAPCVLGRHGVERVVSVSLRDAEVAQLQRSAEAVHGVQSGVKLE